MHRDDIRRRAWLAQHIQCPTCRRAALDKLSEPAPEPSPAEQAVIDRFGIFAEEES